MLQTNSRILNMRYQLKNTIRDRLNYCLEWKQNIEVYFVEKVLVLIDVKKLHPSIKSFLIGLRKNMNKKFKRNTSKSFKYHYDYLSLLTKN